MTDDDQLVLERIDQELEAPAVEPMSPRRRLLIVVAFVITLALLGTAVAGYDVWQNRGGDGYLEGLPSEPEVAWTLPVTVEYGGSGGSPFMAVGDDALLIGPGFAEARGAIRLVSLETGEEIWRHEVAGDVLGWTPFANPEGSVVGYGIEQRLVLLDPGTGEVVGETAVGDADEWIMDVAARGTELYVGSTGPTAELILRRLDVQHLDRPPSWERRQKIGTFTDARFPLLESYVQVNVSDGSLADPGARSVCIAGPTVVFGEGVGTTQGWCHAEGFGAETRFLVLDDGVAVEGTSQGSGSRVIAVEADSGEALAGVELDDPYLQYQFEKDGILRRESGVGGSVPSFVGLDGGEIWTAEEPVEWMSLAPHGVAVKGRARVAMLDQTTGEERWAKTMLSYAVGTTRLGPVFVVDQEGVNWYDGATGSELSRWTPPSGSTRVVGESRRQVIVEYADVDGIASTLQAVDASGVLLWERPVQGEALVRGSALLVYDGSTLSRLRAR